MSQAVDLPFGIGSECQDNIMPTSDFAWTWCPYKHPNMKGWINWTMLSPVGARLNRHLWPWHNSMLGKVLKLAQNEVLSLFMYLVERDGGFDDGLLANESSNGCGTSIPWLLKGSEPQSVSWSQVLKLLGPRKFATHPDSEVL